MASVPVYLKTDPNMPRPADSEFYWITRDGTFFCRNHPFFKSDVPTDREPRGLAKHRPRCLLAYPRLGTTALEYIVGFFDRVFQRHRSEAIVLLLWDTGRKRYKLWVPEQQATVWESWNGTRSPSDVSYKVPVSLPPSHLLAGSIHCHGDLGAYASFTDRHDEMYRDGVHVVVGHIDREPPEFHLALSIDGYRFALDFDHFFKGYSQRRRTVPNEWLGQVQVEVERSTWSTWSSTSFLQDDSISPPESDID